MTIDDDVVMIGSGRTNTIFSEGWAAVCDRQAAATNIIEIQSVVLKWRIFPSQPTKIF